jgi:hypothetical protein
MSNRLLDIARELKSHAPFTLVGSVTGLVCMLLFKNFSVEANHRLFQFFHPAHVVLSALITASLFKLRSKKTSLLLILAIGYFGSIGVATLSDCVIPFLGETMLGVSVPSHAALHPSQKKAAESGGAAAHDHEHDHEHDHNHGEEAASDLEDGHGPHLHLGFIEDWYIVNPAALLGVLLAFWIPHEKLHTQLPHASHVFISVWASSFHVLMNTTGAFSPLMMLGMGVVLFIAVLVPCCISDIIFPMLFVGPEHIPHCCHGPQHRDSS